MATQLISPPKRQAPSQGCALPPLSGLERFIAPPSASLDWLVETAWKWRGNHVIPEVEIPVRVLRESELQQMEKASPQVAALARQQADQARAFIKRTKLTPTIARVERLIVDQYGWPERD